MTSLMPTNSRDLIRQLTPLHGVGEARAIVRLLMEERFHLSQTDMLLGREAALSAQEQAEFQQLAARLLTGEPVQYVLGYTTFCGHRFRVTPDVLIPRPETEGLVRSVLALDSPPALPVREGAVTCDSERNSACLIHSAPSLTGRAGGESGSILDLCTGSGCIAISLALAFPDASVTAVDISPAALDVARQNARDLGANNVRFLQADVLGMAPFGGQRGAFPWGATGGFDLITANPPYVRDSEACDMSPTVLQHEPHLALFVPDEDPLRFYRAIADIGQQVLWPGGLVLVELNAALAEQTLQLFKQRGYTALQLRPDQFGRTRFLAGELKC